MPATIASSPHPAAPEQRVANHRIPGGAFVRITVGLQHACALDASGNAFCWGLNQFGNVGVGSPSAGDIRDTPVAVSGGHHYTSITANYTTTCGTVIAGIPYVSAFALSDGHACASSAFRHQLYCWGYNAYGELGNGQTNTPTVVHWPPARVSLAVQVP